jgi:hypothetical protein
MQQLQRARVWQTLPGEANNVNDIERENLAKQRLADAIVDRTWHIPAYEGQGPVTLTLRLPEVRISDSEGRFIVVSPRQSELVGDRMTAITEWLRYGDGDYETTDDQQ